MIIAIFPILAWLLLKRTDLGSIIVALILWETYPIRIFLAPTQSYPPNINSVPKTKVLKLEPTRSWKTKVNESCICQKFFLFTVPSVTSPIRGWKEKNSQREKAAPASESFLRYSTTSTAWLMDERSSTQNLLLREPIKVLRVGEERIQFSERFVDVFLCLPFFFRRLFSLSRNSQQNWTLRTEHGYP